MFTFNNMHINLRLSTDTQHNTTVNIRQPGGQLETFGMHAWNRKVNITKNILSLEAYFHDHLHCCRWYKSNDFTFYRFPYVCCPQETSTSVIRPSNGRGNVLPGSGSCGVESFGEKVYGGRSTALDEFPWMALLEYSKRNVNLIYL